MSRAWTLAGLTMAAVAVGCQPPPKPAPPPPAPPPPLTVPQERAAAAGRLHEVLARYDADVAPLPGHTADEHRAAAAAALADLSAALRLADGANPSPAFATATGVIDASAGTVGVDGVSRARMEAAETEALHAAATAAREVATRSLYDDADLPGMVDDASAKADAMRVTQGPLHDEDAAAAFRSLGAVLHRVDADYQERFNGGPAVPMSARPAAAMPTSMPATPPAAMP